MNVASRLSMKCQTALYSTSFKSNARPRFQLATYLLPRSLDDAIFLHGVIEELTEFVEDKPARDSDLDDAITAIRRINERLRAYLQDG